MIVKSVSLPLALGCLLIAACASQHTDPAQADSPALCKLNAVKVCEGIRDQPVLRGGSGQTEDQQRIEQNSASTILEMYHFDLPDGQTVEFRCYFNQQRKVVHAGVVHGQDLTESDLTYFLRRGLCTE